MHAQSCMRARVLQGMCQHTRNIHAHSSEPQARQSLALSITKEVTAGHCFSEQNSQPHRDAIPVTVFVVEPCTSEVACVTSDRALPS